MKVTVKAKFNATKERMEKFGKDKYLIYFAFQEDAGANNMIITMLSRHLGVPASKIRFVELDVFKDRIFEVL